MKLTPKFEALRALMEARRSIFPAQFTGEAIPDEVVKALLQCAHTAPSHGRTYPWQFVVFTGEKKTALGEFLAELYKAQTLEEDFKPSKYEKFAKRMAQSSHVIAIIMQRGAKAQIPEIEEVEAVACAVQNLYLATTAQDLGGYWSSGALSYTEAMKEQFGLRNADKFLGFFYLGVPKQTPPAPELPPLETRVEWA